MKKTGKVLSLVLSLALVASSLTATFASAAAENPTAGATVHLTGDTAIALVNKDASGNAIATGVTLPTATVSYTAANGKVYGTDTGTAAGTVTWTSSNPAVAKVSKDTSSVWSVIPGGNAGTATLTCTVSGAKLQGPDSSATTDTVTVSGTETVDVAAYAQGSVLISDDTVASGKIPSATTELAVNATPVYKLYQVSSDTNTAAKASFTAQTADVTWADSNSNVIAIDTTTTAGAATVIAQTPTDVHIGSVRISASIGTGNNKKQASLVIHTAKIYDAASDTVTSSTSYGTGNATVGGYNVTGYAITGTTVTIQGGSVASVEATSAVNVSGGAVTGTVTNNGSGTVAITGGTVGAIDSVGAVTVDSTAAAAKVGAISSDGAVTVSNATVGAIRAKGDITVNSGAVTGSLTEVATPNNTGAFTQTYQDVIVDSSTVKGNVIGHDVTVTSSYTDTTTNALISAQVNGNIVLMKSGSAIIGSVTSGQDNVTVTGSIADNDGSSSITLNGTTDGTTKVGGVVGKAQASSSDPLTTTLTLTGVTGTFASLPNFRSVNVDAGSEVTVNSALKIPALTIGGKATLAAGAVVDGQIQGTGTLTFPAGSLVAKDGFAGGLTINTTSAISTGTVIFKSISNQTGNVTIPGVTLEEKDNGDYTYSYVAKTVTFAGIKLDKSSMKVAKGYTGTLTASVIPAGSSLPTGDKIVWSVPSTDSYVQVTPSADGLTATVKAVDWSDVNLGGANEVTVTAYVADKDGNEVFDYPEQTCVVTAIEKPEGPLYTSDTHGTYNMVVGQSYTFKITASDGSLPPFVVASNGATVAPYTKSGNDYFFKVTGAKVGDYGVYVGGRVCILHITSGIKSDTTKVTIANGKTYQFKITKDAKSASAPQFVVAGQGVVLPVDVKGNDYFYKVTNNGRTGDVGVYVNGPKIAVITFTK